MYSWWRPSTNRRRSTSACRTTSTASSSPSWSATPPSWRSNNHRGDDPAWFMNWNRRREAQRADLEMMWRIQSLCWSNNLIIQSTVCRVCVCVNGPVLRFLWLPCVLGLRCPFPLCVFVFTTHGLYFSVRNLFVWSYQCKSGLQSHREPMWGTFAGPRVERVCTIKRVFAEC